MTTKLILCDCLGSQQVDRDRLSADVRIKIWRAGRMVRPFQFEPSAGGVTFPNRGASC